MHCIVRIGLLCLHERRTLSHDLVFILAAVLTCSPVAELVERLAGIQKFLGSNPVRRFYKKNSLIISI